MLLAALSSKFLGVLDLDACLDSSPKLLLKTQRTSVRCIWKGNQNKPKEKQLTSRRKKTKKSIKMAWRWEVRKRRRQKSPGERIRMREGY